MIPASHRTGALDTAITLASSARWATYDDQQAISWNFGSALASGGTGFDGTTSFPSPSSVAYTDQDGYSAGFFSRLEIAADGLVEQGFSSGRSALAGRVPLARFDLPAALTPMGDHRLAASACSGRPELIWPGQLDAGWLVAGWIER